MGYIERLMITDDFEGVYNEMSHEIELKNMEGDCLKMDIGRKFALL